MTTKITEKNISNLANAGVQWQSVVTADGSTVTSLEAGKGYFIDTTSAAGLVSLPTSSNIGDTIAIKDYAGTFGTNSLTIQRNGHNIQGVANNSQITTNRASIILVYIDSTKGWLFTNESNVADLQQPLYVAATGGTVTTSGNYKIHAFTGDGCFVVSCGGNSAGSTTVDYLVVAGGGSGGLGVPGDGGGGGGAGGYRESHSTPVSGCYTASPLATPTGLTVTATTYPVTVGGGGATQCLSNTIGNQGSNSIFSTITSSGGGAGDANGVSVPAFLCSAGKGGSGGGGHQNAGADGNSPPVSPPQGNPGGTSAGATPPSGAGGGGAGGVGSNNQPGDGGGPGGPGVTTSISGSPTTYSGGGGGANSPSRPASVPSGTGGPGGGGGGGGGGVTGSANTGGGGGGGYCASSGAGGKGIVIIRYKFQ